MYYLETWNRKYWLDIKYNATDKPSFRNNLDEGLRMFLSNWWNRITDNHDRKCVYSSVESQNFFLKMEKCDSTHSYVCEKP